VALSRARLGLYILGRRDVFAACFELRRAFELLLGRPDKLTLVTGELWPSHRILADDPDKEVAEEVVMESVEHLGQYVYEMSITKLKQLRAEQGLPAEDLSAQPEDRAVPYAYALDPIEEDAPEEGQEGEEGEEDPVGGFEAREGDAA